MDEELLKRLRGDIARLRQPTSDPFRWIGAPEGWRHRRHVADDIEALLTFVEAS